MRRLLAALLVASLPVALAVAEDARPRAVINLDEHGALEALRHSNPAHCATIQKILHGLNEQRDQDVPHWILTTFSAQEVDYSNFLLTSEPPKKHLRFVLDDTRYETVVTLRVRTKIVPAK